MHASLALRFSVQDSTHLAVPESLSFLPLFLLAVIKSEAMKASSTIHSDRRISALSFLLNASPETILPYLAPKLYDIHDDSFLQTVLPF